MITHPTTEKPTLKPMEVLVRKAPAKIVYAAWEFCCSASKTENIDEVRFHCNSVQDLKGLQMLLDLMELEHRMPSR